MQIFGYCKHADRDHEILVPSGHFWQHRYDDLLDATFAEEQSARYPWREKLQVAFGRFTATKEPLGNLDVYGR